MKQPPAPRPFRRLALATLATVVTLVGVSLALAAPAMAEPSVGWPDTSPQSPLRTVLLLVGIPVGLFVLIVLMTYVPPLVRGERITPGAPVVHDQWLGGPRKAAGELAAPDDESSKAGGARGTW